MTDEITVRDVMTREYVGVSESDPVDAVVDLMLEDGETGVVVLRGSEPVGMVTERDLLGTAITGDFPPDTNIASVMSGRGPHVHENAPLVEAAGTLSTEDTRHLLVTNGTELVGVLSAQDVIAASASLLARDDREDTPEAELDDRMYATELDYSTQSVCEVCGSFMPSLQNVNGQVVCGDCRSV